MVILMSDKSHVIDLVTRTMLDILPKELPNCPNCGSPVEFMTSRDCEIQQSYIACTNTMIDNPHQDSCDAIYFSVDSMAFDKSPNFDYITTVCKYVDWASMANDTDIKGYRCNGRWD